MAANWAERVSAFLRSPTRFMSGTTAEAFLLELLRELRDDRVGYSVKVLLLSPLCEHPTLLCPSDSVGEETSLELMSVFAQCPSKLVGFRSHLLLALTSVLVCSSCLSRRSRVSQDFVDLLLQLVQDSGDLQADGSQRSLCSAACDCLRELEACCPGLLAQRLELLGGLRQQETSRLHQAYAGLQTLVLRNAVYRLTQEKDAGGEHLKALLGGITAVAWEAEQDSGLLDDQDSAALSSLIQGPMGPVPTLQTGPDCKELRSLLSSLLEESYLLTALSQAALLRRLTEVVAMVPAIPPAIFRAQLLRLLGTSEVCLLHSTLLMKCAFTDSLFSSEDEAFLLRRLVVLSQHPRVSTPEKLFYTDCLLSFPENRPISCGDDGLPVLLTPRLASVLTPTVFNDSATLLSRFNLQCLVHVEEGGEEGVEQLLQQLVSLRLVVVGGGSRELVVTFFRAAFLFLLHFQQVERFSAQLTDQLCELYLHRPPLAPHLLNLADQVQDRLPESRWAVGLLAALQTAVTSLPRLGLKDLRWHLKTLSRVAEEAEILQQDSLGFVSRVASSPLCEGGSWRQGNALLGVCRRLLVHPGMDALLVPLADVLQHLSRSYRDTDVQDHARLYYTLLTTLSRDKLAGVLQQGHAGGGRQVKKRSLSSIMSESEGLTSLLTVHRTHRETFRLTEDRRGPTEGDWNQNQDQDQEQDQEEDQERPDAALEAYRAQFRDPDFASEVSLRYRLVHSDQDVRFQQLFSIRLHFSLSDEHYEPLADVSVPALIRGRPAPTLELKLKPRRPQPTSLRVGAVFSTQDGLTWLSDVPDVSVAFEQTFRPLPSPPAWRSSVFDGLWEEICSQDRDEATSLFCCRMEEAALRTLVDQHLLPYLVSEPTQQETRVLIFLPPQRHVLMKVRPEDDAVHFSIATDDWTLLPHVGSYLLKISADQEKF